MARGRKKLTREESAAVGRKISIIAREQPGLAQEQRVGKAVGIVLGRKRRSSTGRTAARRILRRA